MIPKYKQVNQPKKNFCICKYQAFTFVHKDCSFFCRCQHCPCEFNKKSELVAHQKTHMKHLVQCISCFKLFDSKIKLQRHIESVHSLEWKKCFFCNRKYRTQIALQKHLRVCKLKPGGEESPYQCKSCKLTFKTQQMLSRHMKTHDTTTVR